MKKYKKIRIIIIITAISGMLYLLKDIYKEDNVRLEENTNKLIETTVFSNKIGRMPLPSKACSP